MPIRTYAKTRGVKIATNDDLIRYWGSKLVSGNFTFKKVTWS